MTKNSSPKHKWQESIILNSNRKSHCQPCTDIHPKTERHLLLNQKTHYTYRVLNENNRCPSSRISIRLKT